MISHVYIHIPFISFLFLITIAESDSLVTSTISKIRPVSPPFSPPADARRGGDEPRVRPGHHLHDQHPGSRDL